MIHDVTKQTVDLLHKSGAYSIPVDLDAVAKHLKIRIVYDDFDDSVSGILVVKNGKKVIGVNKRHHPNRQRFTIAHEIGHFVLHHRYSRDPNNDIHIDKKWAYFRAAMPGQIVDERERQANQFAAALLMPEQLVGKLIEQLNPNLSDDIDIARLASHLQVSEQALTIHLLNLNLIESY